MLSTPARTVLTVDDEAQFLEVENVLLYISEARERTERALKRLRKEQAAPFLIAELEATHEAMRLEHKRLLQKTYFRVPGQESMAV